MPVRLLELCGQIGKGGCMLWKSMHELLYIVQTTTPIMISFLPTCSVFMVEPDAFPYAGCANDSAWTCYFEPLTNCSYVEHVLPLLAHDRNQSGM
jgi:hypothetical protein